MNSRLKAFAFHLILSTLIAAGVIALVFGLWYPAPLHSATGVTHIFLILLAVDVCLGPLLTLVVYKQGKKTLVMDLTVIALLQLAALIYGVHTVAEGRPAWLVFNADRFELIRVNDIDTRKLDDANVEYKNPSWLGPRWAFAVDPTSIDDRNTLLFEAALGGVDRSQRPNLFEPIASHLTEIKARALPLEQLNSINTAEAITQQLAQTKAAYAKDPLLKLKWLPLSANNQNMVVLVDAATGAVVKIVDLRPW